MNLSCAFHSLDLHSTTQNIYAAREIEFSTGIKKKVSHYNFLRKEKNHNLYVENVVSANERREER